MNYYFRHLVNGRLGDKGQGCGKAPETRHKIGRYYPLNEALMQFL